MRIRDQLNSRVCKNRAQKELIPPAVRSKFYFWRWPCRAGQLLDYAPTYLPTFHGYLVPAVSAILLGAGAIHPALYTHTSKPTLP